MSERPRAYEREPYRRALDTRVVAVGTNAGQPWAELADTIFYPEGGGQPADQGRLDDARGVDVQKDRGTIRHVLDRALEPGSVRAELDWSRRYDHMQQHTAQHVLTAVAADRFGWPTTSFHLGAEVCDIELDVAELGSDDLARLEDEVAEEIRRDRAITQRRLDPERVDWPRVRTRGLPAGHHGSVRLVDINGLDLNTCGGTHLRSTGEIGTLVLLSTESIRGGTRLVWVAGDRVRRRLGAHEARNAELRRVLGTGDDELVSVAELKIAQVKDAARDLRAMTGRFVEARAEALASRSMASRSMASRSDASRSDAVIAEHEEGLDAGALGHLAREIVTRAPDRLVLLSAPADPSAPGKGGFFVLAAGEERLAALERDGLDVGALGREVAELLDGRGGGKGAFFQGRAGGFERLDAAVALLHRE